MEVAYENRFYSCRNYGLFAILADVRNGRGFAGIKTGEGFNPIADPRGVPSDCCEEFRKEQDNYGSDGHSHSYFTVSELMAYDWTQVTCLQGYVDGKNFEEFERWKKKDGESPSEYCGMVSGQFVTHISNDEMRAVITQKIGDKRGSEWQQAVETLDPHCYTLVEWTQPYYKCCKEFLGETLPRLWQLGKPDDVRIVFFFDN